MSKKERFLKGFESFGFNRKDIEVFEEEAFMVCSDGFENYNLNLFPNTNKEALVDFKSANINKKKFFKLLNKVDEEILMAIEAIVFINSEDELLDYMDEINYYPDSMDIENELGKYLGCYKIVMVNMVAINNYAEENALDIIDNERLVNIGIWTTLLHELRHSIQGHPYFYQIEFKEDEEDDAEEYARKVFDNILEVEEYYVTNK